jgi:DNA-binding NarL/FixJ family response regulator
MEVNVLMIDDHPPIIEGYKSILSFNPYGYAVKTTSAYNCESAYEIITSSPIPFDIVFLDVVLPPFREQKLNSGEDLVDLVRTQFPNAKIVVLTSHTETLVLSRILNHCKPDGLLVKSDFFSEEFLVAFDTILKGKHYYSKTAKNSKSNTILLDNYNRQIIEMLSKGIKTKTIQEQLHLSKSAIDKRKVAIKSYLGIDKGNDEDILREARKRGFI